MTPTRQEFRDGMARLGAAVTVVTTNGPAGRAGFTASAVCSVTDDPPTLLVCMNRTASAGPALAANGVLCVNSLASGDRAIAQVFAGVTRCSQEERFAGAAWGALATGAPVLAGALVAFDCRVAEVVEKGTHRVIFAEVVAVRQGRAGERALIWFARDYHDVGELAAG